MLFFIRICVWLVIWARRLWRRIFYNVLYWFVYFSSISSNTWWSNLKVFHQSIRLIIFAYDNNNDIHCFYSIVPFQNNNYWRLFTII